MGVASALKIQLIYNGGNNSTNMKEVKELKIRLV